MINGISLFANVGIGETYLKEKGINICVSNELIEKSEIVQYCIAHDHNYAQTAEQYQVSYQQARNYAEFFHNFVEGMFRCGEIEEIDYKILMDSITQYQEKKECGDISDDELEELEQL